MLVDWVDIPPGQFIFRGHGKNSKSTNVNAVLSKPFRISRFLVTQAQWYNIMATRPWQQLSSEQGYREGPNFPAIGITWGEACDFCNKLSVTSKLKISLPTEVQWEFSIRAGTDSEYFWGNDYKRVSEFGWTWTGALPTEELSLKEVGLLQPNPWGLFDMVGNVREWVKDRCTISSESPYIKEGHYPTKGAKDWFSQTGTCAILRNAAFNSSSLAAASHFHKVVLPDERKVDFGFRLACED